ncbi:hypothetical protein H5410_003785 [Solanum commersonii]|uniref:Uncharacterized protein n=1 Tax=Solanum commersonii TaxID=4109 RepID=A0A9J6B653_SOLCO|nr:hypothetical protein H5410_003785 [Solanum commersonii]
MSTHSSGHQSSNLGFATSLSKAENTWVVLINAAVDHSARLVGIVDLLGDSPIVRFIAFLACLQHLCILDHWAALYCFAELFGDTSIAPFHRRFDPLPSRLNTLEQKDVSKSAIQDSIMNIHNKTQTTYAKINCALKDSSCDLPISTILMLTILASNASSSSTIVFKCPHTE